MFTLRLVTVPLKVTALVELQVIAWLLGLTVFTGPRVFWITLKVCVSVQPKALTPVTVQVPALVPVKATVVPVRTEAPFVQV